MLPVGTRRRCLKENKKTQVILTDRSYDRVSRQEKYGIDICIKEPCKPLHGPSKKI
jgi:hypothetical protein